MNSFFLRGISILAIASLVACQPADKSSEAIQPVKTQAQINKESPMEYTTPGQTDADHAWLIEVEGEQALEKVKSWNEASAPKMQDDIYKAMKAELLEVYNSPEKIPYVSYRAGKAHNFGKTTKTCGAFGV